MRFRRAARSFGAAVVCWVALACAELGVACADELPVTLLAPAQSEPVMTGVIEEALRAGSFAPRIERGGQASCDAWSRAIGVQPRLLLCVELDGQHRVVVLVLGPGEPAHTRELWLAHGLDELGRETIVHVVELALASRAAQASPPLEAAGPAASEPNHSPQPVAAERAADEAAERSSAEPASTAERGTRIGPAERGTRVAPPAAQGASRSVAAPAPWVAQRSSAPHSDYAIEARGALGYAGPVLGARWSVGADLARTLHRTGRLVQRARLGFEFGIPGQLRAGFATAQLQASALRAGADWVLQTGSAQAVALGVSAGLELVHVSRLRTTADWQPAQSQRLWTSSIRVELRYALSWTALRFSVSAFLDGALHALRFQASQGDERVQLGAPWRFMPGFALGVGL